MPNLTGVQWLALQLEVAIKLNANARGISIASSRLMVEKAARREVQIAELQAEAQAELANKPEGER